MNTNYDKRMRAGSAEWRQRAAEARRLLRDGWTMEQVGAHFGVTRRSVQKWMEASGAAREGVSRFLYLITSGEYIKAGRTSNWQKRKGMYITHNPLKTKTVGVWDCVDHRTTVRAERETHAALSALCGHPTATNREWFEMTPGAARKVAAMLDREFTRSDGGDAPSMEDLRRAVDTLERPL